MAIELVTGHSGEGHVSSADVGRFNAGICGDGKYVLSTGSQFEYTIVSANQVNIASGDAVNQGRHIIIPQNTSESAAIQNGTQGKTRIDVIALRYSKTTTTVNDNLVTVESASVVVIKGTEVNVGSSPAVPAVTSGNIFNGAATDDMPLYHVLITNTSITSVTKVFDVLDPLSELSERITQAVNNMPDLIYPVGSIYMSVNNTNPGTLFGGTWEQIQGKFLLGQSSGHTGGSTGGAETVTLTTAQLPSHTHSVPAHTHTVPNHQHTIPAHTHTATCAEAGNHRHKINRYQGSASGTSRYNIQGSDDSVTFYSNYAGAHKHTITVASKAAFSTTVSGSCTTGSSAVGTSGSTGSGSAVNIMPPFLAVYIWKRTA